MRRECYGLYSRWKSHAVCFCTGVRGATSIGRAVRSVGCRPNFSCASGSSAVKRVCIDSRSRQCQGRLSLTSSRIAVGVSRGLMPKTSSTFKKMKFVANDETGRTRATVAGILMCSSNPEQWLPGAFIQAVRYRGVRQDSNYQLDAQAITGPVDEQIAAAMAFVRRNMKVAARKAPGRVEVPQFSLRAVFEAVVNAAAHRDYAVHGSAIRLFLFDDRLELYSPGPLPNSVTVDALALRQSTRNELLTTLLAKCRAVDPTGEIARQFLMEKRGTACPPSWTRA